MTSQLSSIGVIRSTPAVFQGEEEVHEDRILAVEVIQSSTSDWAAVFLLIMKKIRFWAVVFYYRALNKMTVKGTYPLSLIKECLNAIAGSLWSSK